MVDDKRVFVSQLNVDSLSELLLKLLPNMDFRHVKRVSSNIIDVEIDAGRAGIFTSSYIIFSEQLTRNYLDIQNLVEVIDKKISAGYSKICIVNNQLTSGGFQDELERLLPRKKSTEYWDSMAVLKNIEDNYPDYWRHSDQELIGYETSFEEKINDSSEIKKLVEYKAAYQKLLSIFIEPNLLLRTNDKQSTKKAYTKINLDRLIDENDRLLVLRGDPGTGKTRLLNEIGKRLIQKNSKISGKRRLPIFIDSITIRDSINDKDDVDICSEILSEKLKEHFNDYSIENIHLNYDIVLLVDSIDEFEDKYKNKILISLNSIMDKGATVFVGTRYNSIDDIFRETAQKKVKNVFIIKFNNEQVERFAVRYFENNNKAKGLIDSLKENKIIEKLPLTPLNLSLMSILYEETNNEIPATLNDIYDKFTNLLLGRTIVNRSIDFLDITVKENILGIYALELLKRKNSELMTKSEFVEFFEKNLRSISGTVDLKRLPQALDYIIEHTGLLILYKGKYVRFRHDSYMEYFAAKEIFKNHREMEKDLIDNFFDINWQFAAVFYGGLSRKMPQFLESIIEKAGKSNTMQEYWSATNGMGYLLQALYLTDDDIRKNGIKQILEIMIQVYEGFKRFTSSQSESVYFSKLPLPVLSILPILLFMDNFDSITLRRPLTLAFDELIQEYDQKKSLENYPYLDNIIYRIIILSITFSSDRLHMEDKLLEVIDKLKINGNNFYTTLLESAIDNLGSSELRKQKNSILKPVKDRNYNRKNSFIGKEIDIYQQPINRLRFRKYDKITPNKRVKVFVEGPTDAIILEQAYLVLTGHIPYWEIKVGDPTGGGAASLAKALNEGLAYLEDDQIVIGLFDNDREGLPQFKGTLHSSKFDYVQNYKRIRKRKEGNIYAMLLPVPQQLQYYIQDNDDDNYFSIEHYLPHEFLLENKMLVNTAIPDIYKIKDSNKSLFAKKVSRDNNISLFVGFIILFREIDRVAGIDEEIHYREE